MGQALYRKYRSKSLAEIVGQEHVTTTLANALKSGRISHAYLLTGPRGVGKTSIARILAHEINGLPYDDEAHLDIIEIDAASNRRIDEIRDLRDKVNTAPSAAKYKVYIIDEVHMLTKEAFNALLKTLEEPPAHVIFILATTEAHKLPETIVSRTQRYSFRPVPADQVIAHLKYIAEQEKITIDTAALELIAEHGEGSFRDSISLLDQASNSSDAVTRSDVERILGLAPDEYIHQLLTALSVSDRVAIINALTSLYAGGYEAAMVAVQLGASLRSAILEGTTQGALDDKETLALLRQLLDVPAARSPKQLLELVLLQAVVQSLPAVTNKPSTTATPTDQQAAKTVEAAPPKSVTPTQPANKMIPPKPQEADIPPVLEPITDVPAETNTVEVAPDLPAVAAVEPIEGELSDADVRDIWEQTLNEIKKQYNTLYGIARMAVPELHDGKLTLSLKFAFHQRRVSEAKNRKIIGDAFGRLSGQSVEVYCVVADKPLVASKSTEPGDVSAISNIFGGAELIDS